jgi:hypothetical protein
MDKAHFSRSMLFWTNLRMQLMGKESAQSTLGWLARHSLKMLSGPLCVRRRPSFPFARGSNMPIIWAHPANPNGLAGANEENSLTPDR